MADGWDDALRFVNDLAALAESLVAEETFNAIQGAWPVFTAWSAANNRIVLGSSANFPIDPPTRPSTAGALLGQQFRNAAADRQMLRNTHKRPGVVSIGNAVPYARDVGFLTDNGRIIYEEAAKAGVAAGLRRLMAEWPQLSGPGGGSAGAPAASAPTSRASQGNLMDPSTWAP